MRRVPALNSEIFKPNCAVRSASYRFKCFARTLLLASCHPAHSAPWQRCCESQTGYHMAFIQVEALESGPLGEWERSRRLSTAWCKICSVEDLSLYSGQTPPNHFAPRGSTLFSFPSFAPSLLFFSLSRPLIRINHPVFCSGNCLRASSREPKRGFTVP